MMYRLPICLFTLYKMSRSPSVWIASIKRPKIDVQLSSFPASIIKGLLSQLLHVYSNSHRKLDLVGLCSF